MVLYLAIFQIIYQLYTSLTQISLVKTKTYVRTQKLFKEYIVMRK